MDAGLSAFLEVITGDGEATGFVELRERVGADRMRATFVLVEARDRLAGLIAARSADTDVYVGCAPRSRRQGDRRSVDQVWTLWAECDGAAAAQAARSYSPGPGLIVRSGSGENLHAYWPLREPLRPAEAEDANLRLATAIGADAVCFDAARILRPPGTWNHKHRPPRPVLMDAFRPATRYRVDEVVGGLARPDRDVIARRWSDARHRAPTRDPLLQLAPAVYVAALVGEHPRNGRKVACPFHADVRPSLHVYASPERGWTCFSCRRGGTIYDLAAGLWGRGTRGREFLELRRELLDRFALELSRLEGRQLG